jgi:hypothetical protein
MRRCLIAEIRRSAPGRVGEFKNWPSTGGAARVTFRTERPKSLAMPFSPPAESQQ